jgi:membrane protease YdiL (CAAX protease family)
LCEIEAWPASKATGGYLDPLEGQRGEGGEVDPEHRQVRDPPNSCALQGKKGAEQKVCHASAALAFLGSGESSMTLARALLLIGLQALFVFIFCFGVLGPRLLPGGDPFAPSWPAVALVLVAVAVGGLGFVYLGSVKQPRVTWRELGWHGDRLGSQVLFGVLGGVACVALTVGALLALGTPAGEVFGQMREYTLAQRGLFLLIGVQAGFIEESLFRGNLLRVLEKRMNPWAALGVSALVFAIYHLNPSPVSLALKTAIGLVLGWLAQKQKSLVAPAIAHALMWVLAGNL